MAGYTRIEGYAARLRARFKAKGKRNVLHFIAKNWLSSRVKVTDERSPVVGREYELTFTREANGEIRFQSCSCPARGACYHAEFALPLQAVLAACEGMDLAEIAAYGRQLIAREHSDDEFRAFLYSYPLFARDRRIERERKHSTDNAWLSAPVSAPTDATESVLQTGGILGIHRKEPQRVGRIPI